MLHLQHPPDCCIYSTRQMCVIEAAHAAACSCSGEPIKTRTVCSPSPCTPSTAATFTFAFNNRQALQMAVWWQDLHARLHSSQAAVPHGSGGPFASSPEGQSLREPPPRATPGSPQSSRSSTGWPALVRCLDPCTPWGPATHQLH